MKNQIKFFALFALAILSVSCLHEGEKTKAENHIKACSFNIRYDNPADGLNQWENRKENIVNFLQIEKPEIIGLQEALLHQLEYLELHLSDYARVGVGRDDGHEKGEFAAILYQKDRFELKDKGNFWLSENPAEPGLGWDANNIRICSWAILEDKWQGEELHVYNTHFDHMGSEARLRSSQLIMDTIEAKSKTAKLILSGDFNTTPGSAPYNEIIGSGLNDSYDCGLRLGPVGTSNGWKLPATFDKRIDYIFTQGLEPEYYVANSIVIDNRFLSDHFPVVVMLKYAAAP